MSPNTVWNLQNRWFPLISSKARICGCVPIFKGKPSLGGCLKGKRRGSPVCGSPTSEESILFVPRSKLRLGRCELYRQTLIPLQGKPREVCCSVNCGSKMCLHGDGSSRGHLDKQRKHFYGYQSPSRMTQTTPRCIAGAALTRYVGLYKRDRNPVVFSWLYGPWTQHQETSSLHELEAPSCPENCNGRGACSPTGK